MSDLLDDGLYTGVIVKSEVIESEYMVNQWNPTGICVNLHINVDDSDKRVFKRLNKTQLNKLLEEMGEEKVSNLEDFDPDFLMRKRMDIEIQQYTSKAQKVSNIVVNLSPFNGESVQF